MKNKFFTLFVLMLLSLFGNCVKVSAMEYKADSIPNNAYVIGNHMFTEKVVLTTKHIMLGATTIDSDSLSDMVIYYRTPWGEWWDGLTGETINVPNSFDIQYIDTKLLIETPIISSSEEVSYTDDLHGKKYNLVLDKINNITGVQLYFSAKEDGEYTLVKDYKIEELNNNFIEVEIKGGCNYYYKVKTYKTTSDINYSEFSNVINIDNSLLQPSNISAFGGFIPEDGDDETHDTALYFLEETIKTKLGNNPDGIEVYFSLEEDGEYTLLRKITYEDLLKSNEDLGFSYAHIPGYVNYFKIRSYIEYDNEILFSEYRNVKDSHKLSAPTISKFQPLSVNEDNFSYGVDIYLNNIYASNFQRYPSGVDVLYSTEEKGEYEVLTSVSLTDMNYAGAGTTYIANIDVPVGNKYFIKLRKYVMVNEEKIVGEKYSEILQTAMYNITYNLDGGEFYYQEGKYSFEAYDKDTEFTIKTPIKEGYIFLGWTGSNGDTPQKEVTITKGTIGNLDYTANWVLYGDVNLDGQLNTKDTRLLRKFLSGDETLSDIQQEIADVNQDGKVEEKDADSILYHLVGHIKSFPCYDIGEKYIITIDKNDGSEPYTQEYYTNLLSLNRKIEIPQREGYIFLGWTGSNGNAPQIEVIIDEKTTGNLEYIANWEFLQE